MLFKNSIRAEAAFVSSQMFARKIPGTADSGTGVQYGSEDRDCARLEPQDVSRPSLSPADAVPADSDSFPEVFRTDDPRASRRHRAVLITSSLPGLAALLSEI